MTEVSKPNELHQELVQAVLNTKKNFVYMGRLLYELKRGNSFRSAVGEGIDTWIDYISQPEIGLSKGDADRLVQIYEMFVLVCGFAEEYLADVPIKNLHYLLPIVKRHDYEWLDTHIDDLMDDAIALSQKDFKERIHDLKDDSGERTYTYMIMKKSDQTGNMSKVHGIESEDIKTAFKLDD